MIPPRLPFADLSFFKKESIAIDLECSASEIKRLLNWLDKLTILTPNGVYIAARSSDRIYFEETGFFVRLIFLDYHDESRIGRFVAAKNESVFRKAWRS